MISPAERRHKLDLISRSTIEELEGWVREAARRGYFDGELEAIRARIRSLEKKA